MPFLLTNIHIEHDYFTNKILLFYQVKTLTIKMFNNNEIYISYVKIMDS